jgi:hypothetical protein
MRVSLFKILTFILFFPLISGGYNEIEKHQRKKENGCKSLDHKKKALDQGFTSIEFTFGSNSHGPLI